MRVATYKEQEELKAEERKTKKDIDLQEMREAAANVLFESIATARTSIDGTYISIQLGVDSTVAVN